MKVFSSSSKPGVKVELQFSIDPCVITILNVFVLFTKWRENFYWSRRRRGFPSFPPRRNAYLYIVSRLCEQTDTHSWLSGESSYNYRDAFFVGKWRLFLIKNLSAETSHYLRSSVCWKVDNRPTFPPVIIIISIYECISYSLEEVGKN